MKTTTTLKLTAAIVALYALSACSPGFSTSPSSSTSSGNNGQSTDGGGGNNGSSGGSTTNPLDSVDMKGFANGGDSDGALVVDLDKTNMALTISVPITLTGLNLSFNASVPNYPDIQIYNYVDSTGMSRMAVRVPLKYILKGVNFGNPSLLPNGQVLPFVGGELPSTNVVINAGDKSKVYLYIGSGAFAVYVSHPSVPSYLSVYVPIRNKAGTQQIGVVGVAAKTSLGDGGFVISAKIPAAYAKILDDYLGSL